MMTLEEIDQYMKRSLAASKGFKWGAPKKWVDVAIELRRRLEEARRACENTGTRSRAFD